MELLLDSLEKALIEERERVLEEVLSESLRAYIVYYSKKYNILTLQLSRPHDFMPGDPVGIVLRRNDIPVIKDMGVVINRGEKYLDLVIFKQTEEKERLFYYEESGEIEICDIEQLISYDLQLDLISFIKTGELSNCRVQVLNRNAIDLFLEEKTLGAIDYIKLDDTKDVSGNFDLDSSQVKAIEAGLALKSNELLLIIGPPGTGKTRVIAKLALELVKKEGVFLLHHILIELLIMLLNYSL